MFKLTGAQLLVRLLERQGIRIVAGIPGGMNLPLYDALSHSTQIRHVLARHEQGAGFMAQGMARVTGKPAVCLATSGPGATNILTAVADAKLDSIPVVCITGQVPATLIGTDAFQEVDTYGLSIPITKHNYLVRSAGELLETVPEAFRISVSGRPGPVLIDVPKDVQLQTVEFESWPEPGRPDPAPNCPEADLDRAVALLNAARRPVLYLGGGVIHAGAGPAARQLAERASMPAAMTLMGLGALPADHPLALGMLGMHGARGTNLALEECDLLFVAGARFGDRTTGKLSHFCPQAQIIHLDIDASEIDKLKTAEVGLVGDAREVLAALLCRTADAPRADWLARVAELKARHPLPVAPAGDVRTPYGLIRSVAALLPADAVIATDVGQHQMWTAQTFPHRTPRCWLTSGGLGTMGFGLPAAVGAALAEPARTIISFSGDGSLLMNIQELATAAEENLNVKVVLFNNQALGLVHQQQDLFYDRRYIASDFRIGVDFVKIAQGFGVRAFDLAGSSDPQAVLTQALNTPGPALIHAPIDVNAKVYPMVPPGAANAEMIG